jgi:glyoxylase-like metal-dependent hydrolase (beta-lactamase superfamily II)
MAYEWIENEVKEVGPGVWIRVAIDNISWCELGNCGVIIDALEDPTQADVVRGLLKETSGQDLKYIVTTHWDADHIACNPQWKSEGAVDIAHESCAQSAGDWEGRPDVTFNDQSTLYGSGDKRIEMRWLGGTHTPWDTILYFPHAKVLHIADLFGWGLIPCQPTTAKVERLRYILDEIQKYDANAIICGHGPVTDMACIARFQKYFEVMLQSVPPLVEQGLSVEEIEAQVPAPNDMHDWWRFTAWKHKKNIELIRDFHGS